MARKIGVELVGDERDLLRAFSRSARAAKQFNSDVSKIGRGAVAGSGAFRGLGRSIAFASGAFLGAAGFTSVVRAAFDEMSQAQQVSAQTAQALKTTGGVAGVTAKQVDDLAQSLLNLSGVDDEAIKGAENLLLTFTRVRNEIGKGNDIFDQATKAALDLSVRFGKDLSQSAVLVGRALNDPVRGLTALRRVGVSFTDDQAKLIKRLVETGHVLEAQKIILRELTVETGGAAAAAGETLAGRFNILKENVRNLAGTLAQEFQPAISRIIDRMSKWISNTENQRRVQEKFHQILGTARDIIDRIRGVIDTVVGALGGWRSAITIMIGAFAGFKAAGIGAAVAIQLANIVAAQGTAAAWRAALIATGWGAFAVAAGIATAEIIAHWEEVKRFFQGFWLFLQEGFDRAFLAIVEPFSHLPFGLGGWAQDLKKQLQQDITDLQGMFTKLQETATKGPAARPAAPAAAAAATAPFVPHSAKGLGATTKAAAATARGFQLPFRFQLEQAKAEASGVQAQIVKAAHDVAVFLAKVIPKLKGQKLLDALSLFAQANSTVAAANQAAAEKAKHAAATAKQAAQKAAQHAQELAAALKQFSVPLVLQVAQAQAEALGKSIRPILLAIKQAALKALKSGRLGLQGQLDAWNTIAQVNQQLADLGGKTKKKARAAVPADVMASRAWGRGFNPTFGTGMPGAVAAASPSFTIANVNLYGVQNVKQFEDELGKRAKQRAQPRRGR